MKKLIFLLILFPTIIIAQKNNNGKVYDQHPALDIAEKFGQAWISGDAETLKSLVGEDFRMGSAMNTNPNYEGGDINDLIGQSSWMTNNFVNISLKNKGQAYPDAIEYKRSGLFVQTFQEFIAWDKNNGFKIKTPFNAIFVFDKKGEKIIRFWWADNRAVWQNWNLSRQTIKNGTIYKDHPNIGKVRLVYYNVEQGNLDATFENFSKNARIYDSNLIDKEYNSLEVHIQNVGSIFSKFEVISLDEVGYPDYMDYEGDGGVAYIWMNFTLKNKKTNKIVNLPVHSQMWFSEEGMIVREDVYYNANILN
ncbi:hypothetical protein N9N57_00795 [Flavobacteriaceae bacterium]|jgi:hypothetical protein|nr:hypothetical protein [Flavobacteriaceae bacterium]